MHFGNPHLPGLVTENWLYYQLEKSQITSTKKQINLKFQFPMTKFLCLCVGLRRVIFRIWVIGICLVFVIWNLKYSVT